MTVHGQSRIAKLKLLLELWKDQADELTSFAYQGVRSEISQSIGYIKSKKPDDTIFLPKLIELSEQAVGPRGKLDFGLDNLGRMLEKTKSLATEKELFAYKTARNQVQTMRSWVDICKEAGRASEHQLSHLQQINHLLHKYPGRFTNQSSPSP